MKISDVIASAAHELNTSIETDGLWFDVLIRQALRSIKSSGLIGTYTNQRLTVWQNKATLPQNCTEVICIAPIDQDNLRNWCPGVDYSEQNDLIIFSEDLAIDDGQDVFITYKGLKLSSDGEIIIPSTFERALVSYCGWKFYRKNYSPQTQGIMADYRKEWAAQQLAQR